MVSSRCPRNLKLAAYEQDLFFFWGTPHISNFTWISIRHFPLCKCKQNSFSRHCNARLSAVKVWDIIENRACAAVVHGFSKPRTTSFSSPEPVVSWSRGRETRVGYKLSRVALGTRMRTTFECIYTNTFTSKVNSGLDKPIPKPFGQDKPRLELALGWISREHRFFTIYTAIVSRGLFSLV